MQANLTLTADGYYCLEGWEGERKITVYVRQNGETWCLLTGGGAEEVEKYNLFDALKFLRG